MDITLDVGEYKLNMRAAGLIIHNGKLLVHRNINKDHYALVGGRIEIGEDSVTALKREVSEELAKDVEVLNSAGIIENFYMMNNHKYHEIMFIHKAEFTNKHDAEIIEELKNAEGKEHLKYVWIDIDKIEDYNIMPEVIKEIVKSDSMPVHKVWNEI